MGRRQEASEGKEVAGKDRKTKGRRQVSSERRLGMTGRCREYSKKETSR